MEYNLYEKKEIVTGIIVKTVVVRLSQKKVEKLQKKFNVKLINNEVKITFEDFKEFERFRVFILKTFKVRNLSFEIADLILDFIE